MIRWSSLRTFFSQNFPPKYYFCGDVRSAKDSLMLITLSYHNTSLIIITQFTATGICNKS